MAALCPESQIIWKLSPLRLDTRGWEMASVEEWCCDMAKKLSCGNSWELFLMFWWKIWEVRNLWLFEKKKLEAPMVCAKTLSLLGEYEAAAMRESSVVHHEENGDNHCWKAPPPNKFTLNTDAALSKDGKIGLGMVMRDHLGDVMMAGGRAVTGVWSACNAEAEAMLFGLRYAFDAGLRRLLVSSDCLNLINMLLSKNRERTPTQLLVDDILYAASLCDFCTFNFQPGTCNKVAHSIAKYSLTLSGEQLWMEDCPPLSLPFVISDKVALI
ncbi:uncharacterized protein LOC110683897 [Chenopodium quinoa]|uniref:uncharacterized protein LOC110683897 n=1 Tax=Chenopodium quinoa TaxID=63459 RepID=UPI000B78DA55|nr:uncharacterized protein LOC110683897 [Chenopodium quinoa]